MITSIVYAPSKRCVRTCGSKIRSADAYQNMTLMEILNLNMYRRCSPNSNMINASLDDAKGDGPESTVSIVFDVTRAIQIAGFTTRSGWRYC